MSHEAGGGGSWGPSPDTWVPKSGLQKIESNPHTHWHRLD